MEFISFYSLKTTVGIFITHPLVLLVLSHHSSIETAKQKLDKDRLHQEAKLKIAAKQKKLAELRKEFKQLQGINQSMSEHSWLTFEVQNH